MTRSPAPRRPARLALLFALVLAACSGGATPTSEPTELVPTTEEQTLLSGMRTDLAETCRPLRGDDLVEAALAGLECVPPASAIAAARIYLFNSRDEMLERYLALLDAAGVPPRSEGSGRDFKEAAYIPGDEPGGPLTDTRHGHYVDIDSRGRYLATLPPFVLLVVAGTDANVNALYDWAWRGNQDVPGSPTVWSANGPRSPEGKG